MGKEKLACKWLAIILVIQMTGSLCHAFRGYLCKQLNKCSCQYLEDGTVVDLTSLGNKDGTPRFHDVQPPDGLMYSYNPCGVFTEGDCKDVAVCLKSSSGETCMIGSAAQPEFSYDEIMTRTFIGYSDGQTATFVYLICDARENPGRPELFANGTLDQIYLLTLYTVCACGGGCDSNGPISKSKPSSGIGAGIYICIGIVSLIVLYFLIGSFVMKFGMKKTGKDVLPNSAFWCNLPTLIKDCSVWCFEKCFKGIITPI